MTDSTLTAVHHRTLKVMLVDDQRLARTGFSLMLAKTGTVDVIAEASDGQQAIQVLDSRYRSCDPLPNVILMDVRMPVMDGIEATRRITISYPSVKVLVLTTYDEDDYAFGALAAGASGFLLKDVRAPQLATALQSVSQGDAILTPRITRQVLERGVLRASSAGEKRARQAQFAQLSPREFDIARLIADGLSNAEIAQKLVLQPASIRRNVSRILAKLELRDRVQIAVEWYKSGM
ncbi:MULTISPECIES: response regulator [Auritidibacter]|uniref:response regulator n=1 Tax=Auritidibacter TaxID=1160973 RepID=UPI000D72C834|nr:MULTISPECIES: response regulator transcription factor [Auritidibacter]PXA75359.1 DNA-binding response regulator [Auritidibacter sp. NML120779]AXR73385.1 DNA-binding response regulator [Auritidibacter sp. NML130574]NIH70825.1 DNA-binding NarL/FixJ family response regulator [Auritidibacter ignavus]RMX21452.1 DNA-binding response regulator [Auritidibacter ignavus]WGH81960.1 response regulator transcription factor [Auritidibacter ignavus]